MDEQEIDRQGLKAFAAEMAEKLEFKRQQGRQGWHDPDQCSLEDLYSLLNSHLKKGDMVDIANFAMMIWNRENAIKDKIINKVDEPWREE